METKKETVAGLEGVSQAERSGLLRTAPVSGKTPESDPGKHKQQNIDDGQPDKSDARFGSPALRVLLWILRKSIVPALCVIAVIGGMYIGYSILGKRPAADVFQWATWKHMYDLVFADT